MAPWSGPPLAGWLAVAQVVSPAGAVAPARLWLGTIDQWIQGLGIAFAVLDLVLLALAWRSLRAGAETGASRAWLLVALGIVPVSVAFLASAHGIERSTTVAACGSCHVMRAHVADLLDGKSESLAAVHAKHRYIRERHCYTCHSDYGLAGTIQAKLAGLGHVWKYTTGAYALPLHIAQPYPNARCLECHGESVKFRTSGNHPEADLREMVAEKTSCLDCHGPAHLKQAAGAGR